MKVMKFGGSSLANAALIKKVGSIVAEEHKKEPAVVVLSAMKGVTDQLLLMADLSEQNDATYKTLYNELKERILSTTSTLIEHKSWIDTEIKMTGLLGELEEVLHGIELVRECSPRSLDLVASFGERLNAILFSDYLTAQGTESAMVDARELIITNENYGSAQVLFSQTYENVKNRLGGRKELIVVPGFIASTESGITTTLGRNGSDYTASVLAAGLGSKTIEIWTDVDGVLSSDPNIVKNAFVQPEINYQEAMELSYFGAKVIHPQTMVPALELNIPILIKNTLHPEVPGTIISSKIRKHTTPITGIASIEDVALINIEGSGMIGVPGTASRVFTALAASKVNVMMISQASSEHSICLVCRQREAPQALEALRSDFKKELETKKIQQFELIEELEIIAVIGENMRGTPGISGKLFSSLGKEKINILAIAQGSSERNISFVISKKDTPQALTVIHREFLEKR
jgi:bifunctional aspartokinase / homoserine dehydrogenase 1